jgi:indole-3-glycerol phosphate synthase
VIGVGMILTKIIENKREEVDAAQRNLPVREMKEMLKRHISQHGSFKRHISKEGRINLIAEIKKSSPSKGIIREDFDPVKIASAYRSGGTSAISVLTDTKFFDGKLRYIKDVKEHVDIPVLRKDFIIDDYQVYESVLNEANAILLIARILTLEELKRFKEIAGKYGMDCLVETHNEEDIEKALDAQAEIIGINNRNLSTFEVDLAHTERLIKMIPSEKISVAESGIKSYEDMMFLKSLGVNAALVGETFMRADNIEGKVRELLGA